MSEKNAKLDLPGANFQVIFPLNLSLYPEFTIEYFFYNTLTKFFRLIENEN